MTRGFKASPPATFAGSAGTKESPSTEGVRGSLHSAAAAGNVTDIQRLIAGGASVNRSTLGGVAPLHMAAHNGHTESIARLLAARAEVNQLAPGGTTALLLGFCLARLLLPVT